MEPPKSSRQSVDVPRGGRGEGADPDLAPAEERELGAPYDVAAVMTEIARDFVTRDSVEETLEAITSSAVDTVPGVRWASITLVTEANTLETRAATDPLVRKIDEIQNATNEGPCLSALREGQTMRVDDVEMDGRWPTWAEQVVGLSARSMLCFTLIAGDRLGALNLYGDEPRRFDDESENVGVIFAAHAAVALAGAKEVDQLRAAISTRDVIGQAKGILMERHNLGADEAFHVLVRASQESHMKLRDVADRVVRRD